jgi:hypothetical protein
MPMFENLGDIAHSVTPSAHRSNSFHVSWTYSATLYGAVRSGVGNYLNTSLGNYVITWVGNYLITFPLPVGNLSDR